MKTLVTGNEAIAHGALAAGVHVVTGYPGTPSTGVISSLLGMRLSEPHVEWSVNEKVAIDIAAGVAWAGKRVLTTMKMSGLNVAYDTIISVAYSGVEGGMVIYVADDPGVSAGMCEQDSRGFAMISDMPMLEPTSVEEAYWLTKYAFELSEATKTPVFLRLVAAIASSYAPVALEPPVPPSPATPLLLRDITRFTKAGPGICMAQHKDLIHRLDLAGKHIIEKRINTLSLSKESGGLGIIAAGVAAAYLEEGCDFLEQYGLKRETLSLLKLRATHPFPEEQVKALLGHCQRLLVLEELEPHLERSLYIAAQQMDWEGAIYGKLDGTFSRIGEYKLAQVLLGIAKSEGLQLPIDAVQSSTDADRYAVERPISVCAGCPHRGTYMAINQAIRSLKLKKAEVMVTGDIGCTILGINPPFDTIWNEISMGAGVSAAQGFYHAGVKTPVIATIGDSTFFHGGIPGLINAIQNDVPLTLIIMDNRWTAMTGMQVNPGTPDRTQKGDRHIVDIARLIPALGVEHFFEVDPLDQAQTTQAIQTAMTLPGVKVVLARRECAIQAQRLGDKLGRITVVQEKCNLCKLCIMITGCSALSLGETSIAIDPAICYGCGICVVTCNRKALIREPIL